MDLVTCSIGFLDKSFFVIKCKKGIRNICHNLLLCPK